MPDLRNSYLQCTNAECLPCVLHAMPDYFNLMNAILRTCINSRNACISNHNRVKTAQSSLNKVGITDLQAKTIFVKAAELE